MRLTRKLKQLIEEASEQDQLEALAKAQGISLDELLAAKEKMQSKLKKGKPRGSANKGGNKLGKRMSSAGISLGDGIVDQVIKYDVSNNKFNSVFGTDAKDTKGEVEALVALRDIDTFIKGVSKASDEGSAKLDRVPFKEFRKDVFSELSKAGVSSLDGEISKLVEVTDDLDDATEKVLLKKLISPYGIDKSEEYDAESEKIEKVKTPIKGPYRSFIAQMGLTPYSGKENRETTGGSRYMKSNPFSALAMEWNMDDFKGKVGDRQNLNNLLDAAAEGKLTDAQEKEVTELYEAYLVDKRIADKMADVTGFDYEKAGDSLPAKDTKVDEVDDVDDAELGDIDLALNELGEESRTYRAKGAGSKTMKMLKEERQRRKLVIEESRRYFSKKKTALVDFVEESLEGLNVTQTVSVKRKLSGKNGEWIKENISTVIRKVVEEGMKSKRKLIKESRSEGRSLVIDSKGEEVNRKVNRTESKGMSLVEESVSNKKLNEKETLVEEERIVDNGDEYSKAGQFM